MPFSMFVMVIFKKFFRYLSIFELCLWLFSIITITTFFLIFDGKSYLELSASLIGATALIFCAKGNPIGQALIIVFSTLYGIISYTCGYYGELITYAGMSLPMAVTALISWLSHPHENNHAEVHVEKIGLKDFLFALFLDAIVTTIFYFILKYFNTTNLTVSTISISTSFYAVYLTFRRSPYYALAYVLNDIVLIVLWSIELASNTSALSVLVCFIIFLINDSYGFYNWKRLYKKQNK